jgi:hypothetical protein
LPAFLFSLAYLPPPVSRKLACAANFLWPTLES